MPETTTDPTPGHRGTLFIIAAPSGAGKTTLVRALCNRLPNLHVSVSCTTRPRREEEQDGIDYYFIDEATFRDMAARGLFLEYEQVFDYLYGTPLTWVEEHMNQGIDVILEIDWQGARDVRARMPGTVSLFILPPSYTALEKRLRGRGQDDERVIKRRMQDALGELSHHREFDYLIINKDLETALAEMTAIIEAVRENRPLSWPDRGDFADALIAEGEKFQ